MRKYTPRTRKACLPCRERKRKCNGDLPCDTCRLSDVPCTYQRRLRSTTTTSPSTPRRNSVRVPTRASARARPRESPTPANESSSVSLQANSGSGFLRQLVGKMDTTNSPYLRATAWNVGCHAPPPPCPDLAATRITDLLSCEKMLILAEAYFNKIDPCYGFINRERVFREVGPRWISNQPRCPYDAVLCGVAALGSYFSPKSQAVPTEPVLVALAKSILDSTNTQQTLAPDILNAWVCRIIYLRVAADPLDAWLACCTTMHLFEAAALNSISPFLPRSHSELSSNSLPEDLHPTFVVAQHHSIWIAYEMGLSHVQFPSLPELPDSAPAGNYTKELLALLPASLDLLKPQDNESLRSVLAGVIPKRDREGPLIMAQCNLILCLLRRMWNNASFRDDDDELIAQALNFLKKGLAITRTMIQDDDPWHHLANVPFQTICISLAIDTPASLRLVGEAVQALINVKEAYPTTTMIEAYNTTSMLLYLHQKQHSEKMQAVGHVLNKLLRPASHVDSILDEDVPIASNDAELARIKALMPAFPELQDIDINEMLAQYTDYMQPYQGLS